MNSNLRGHRSWRKILRAIALASFVGFVGALVVYLATREKPPAQAAPIQARLELAAGQVWVRYEGQATRAVSGAALMAGAQVGTDKGARALVQLPDGSRVFLRDQTRLELFDDSVKLLSGEYWVDAAPTERKPLVHQVDAVSISATDAGLSVVRGKQGASVYVARGMAIVSGPGGRAEVRAGEQASMGGSGEPRVSAVAFWEDWTGGMADLASGRGPVGAGSGSIYGVDSGAPAGSPPEKLTVQKQVVHAVIRGGLSETRVDQTFFNPGERDVEGWYWFSVPASATVIGFAVETDGVLVEGEFIEKKQAARQYGEAKASGHAPAILEYVDGNTYRARIYPVRAGSTRRVVLRYLELRTLIDGRLVYTYPMGEGEPVRIGEFSLSVDLGDEGEKMQLSTLADARVEDAGRRVTMRRSGYTPRAAFQLEARLPKERPPLTVARFAAGDDSADYLLARYTPDVDWESVADQRGDIVVVVDTSAAGDEAGRQLKAATAEAILRALSDSDRFALVSLDVKPTVLHPHTGLVKAADREISKALEALAEHSAGGATDLAALFDVSLSRLHGAEQPAVIYVGDGIATSGELTGEQLTERLGRSLSTSRARLFTVGVGSDADHALLGELARTGGGEAFRVERTEDTTARALEIAAALKVPTITDLDIDLGAGLDEVFVSAQRKLSKGSELVVLARSHHALPAKVKVTGRLGGKPLKREYPTRRDTSVINALVPKLWAAEYVERLLGAAAGPDAERGRIVALGVEYGLVTPFTSVLALESEAAYATMGIQRNQSPLRGVRLTALDPWLERRLESSWVHSPAQAVMGCSREEPAKEGGVVAARAPLEKSESAEDAPAPMQLSPPPLSTASPPADAPAAEEPTSGLPEGDSAAGAEHEEKSVESAARALAPKGGRGAVAPARAKRARRAEPKSAAPEPSPVYHQQAELELGTCSDAAARPLGERVRLWKQRLKLAESPDALRSRYEAAWRACELADWRAEGTFLQLLQMQVTSEAAARLVLSMFETRPEVKKYVAGLILRRTVDEAIVAAVERAVFGRGVDWTLVDLELQRVESAFDRLALVRQAVAKAPEDPNGGIRLVGALVEAGQKDQAVALGRRLRDQGLLTPAIARRLGDALAAAGLSAEAVRTYSEIVEFDPESTPSRQLLGDIYLEHGWYGPAYRQYKTLTELSPEDALGWLRLASAAAGDGRVDEALRLERKVASGQGTPGPDDPRRWARLQSAVRLATLLQDERSKAPAESVKRKLKELGLFSGPGVLCILTWQKLDSDVSLTTVVGDAAEARGEATDAARAGLSARILTLGDAQETVLVARLRSAPLARELPLTMYRLTWDGRDFRADRQSVKLEAQATRVEL